MWEFWILVLRVVSFICTDHVKQEDNYSKYFKYFCIIPNILLIKNLVHICATTQIGIYFIYLEFQYRNILEFQLIFQQGQRCCVCGIIFPWLSVGEQAHLTK